MDANIKLKNGNTLEIYQDMSGESPREWDNLGKMICFHKRYNLGDKHDIDHSDYSSWQELIDENFSEDDVVINLYLLDHSCLRMSTSPFLCPWDSGQVGIYVVTRREIIDNYGTYSPATISQAKRCIEAEVETYDQYLNGEVYGYVLKDSKGEEIDSCFGFYGYDPTTNGIFYNLDLGEEDVA
jgi:hypothetical protein